MESSAKDVNAMQADTHPTDGLAGDLPLPRHDAPGPASVRGTDPQAIISVRMLSKQFRREDGSIVHAVDGIDLDVHRGEFVVLLGPSGCGKTTLLRCIAGLEDPNSGLIDIQGRRAYSSKEVIRQPPQRRNLSMIFQSYALWPHMTAYENVAYPLKSRKVPRKTIADRVHAALEKVGIAELAKQYPAQMSGGQQQRVALARALVSGDELILFDEPLSNVDAKVREQLRVELMTMQREIGFSALYVTHDQTEAMELATRIAVMRDGQITQLGEAREIYDEPRTRYVANFIGSVNEVRGHIADVHTDTVTVRTDIGTIVGTPGVKGLEAGDEVVALCRPERCKLVPKGAENNDSDKTNELYGEVEASVFLGSHTQHVVLVGGLYFRVWDPDPEFLEPHTDAKLIVAPRDVRILPQEDLPYEEIVARSHRES
jgi:iron(III) transport system ATP-binding protein